MATLDSFREAAGEPIQLDLANGYIADVRLNSGDVNGRTITVELTDNGTPITTTDGITCALAYNTSPGSDLGDRVTMNAVSGAATATFRAAVPRKALAKPGRILLGIEISSGGNKVCSRNFYGLVERSVFDATSPDADDKLGRIEQLILDADKAIIRINKAVSDARITGGNTTTLDPNQPATSSLRGSGLQRVLDLSIPRGAGVTSAGATTLDPNKPATASMLQAGSKGDYTLLVGVPRGSRIIGVAANTVNPSQQAAASMSTDGAGDRSLILDIPRGERIAGVTARTLDAGMDATVTATRDAAGDTTLAFGLPRGAKGDPGDPGTPATATTLGVVKPDGTTITADTDGTISAFTATASTLMGEGGATMGDALEVAPGIWLCIIRQWVITTQGGYYDAFSFSVYDRAGSRIALAASPTAGTYLILPVAGNARTKEYNYDTLMGKWVCTTTNTADTAQPDPCTLLLRARA
ncbi:BppU family phage baseplate upper protein [Bifidobacterium bifidum]|uniref:BppU family phage baseplate upper protein n=1 Tax=Bifidobacterium bifidum TaxID=1681 RepID=UPI00398D0DAB